MTTAPVGRTAEGTRRSWLHPGTAARLPRLVLLPAPQRRSRLPFALIVLLLIGSGLIGLLLINTVLAQDAFVLFGLQQKTAALSDQEQQLRETVAREAGPTVLASRAASLGMVPGGNPLFLRLPDGAVLGDPKGAGGVAPQPTTHASISPTPTPSSTAPSPTAASPTALSPTGAAAPTAGPTGALTGPLTVKPSSKPTLNPTVRASTKPSAKPTAGPKGARR